jgi:hypothetical protein
MNDLKWSKTEKTIARRAFDSAYERECENLAGRLKDKAEGIKEPRDLWLVHEFLSGQLKRIEQKYDFRYSILILVFDLLLKEGWLKESDLAGISEDKIEKIRSLANLKC